LKIFDPNVANKLNEALGRKSERLYFWLEVLKQNGQRLLAKRELFRLEMIQIERFFTPNQLGGVPTVSLDDQGVVSALVHEAERRVLELNSAQRQLGEFIKATCSYSELFDG
jgi:hypothetical protein